MWRPEAFDEFSSACLQVSDALADGDSLRQNFSSQTPSARPASIGFAGGRAMGWIRDLEDRANSTRNAPPTETGVGVDSSRRHCGGLGQVKSISTVFLFARIFALLR